MYRLLIRKKFYYRIKLLKGHRQIKNTNRIHRAVAMKISKSEPQPENHRWVSQSDLGRAQIRSISTCYKNELED